VSTLRYFLRTVLGSSLATSVTFASIGAQQHGPYVYVSKVVGQWVLVDSGRTIHVLDRVPLSASVAVRTPDSATKAYSLVLRDPRTLKTATLSCDPTVRCRASRHVSGLAFAGSAIETTARTGRLFVHLAEGDEARGRVALLGARGGGRDWGLIVLTVHSGRLDLSPLKERIGAVQSELVVRRCALDGPVGTGQRCEDAASVGASECAIESAASCPMDGAGTAVRPFKLVVFERDGTTLSTLPVGFATAVVASEAQSKRIMKLAGGYARDLAALRSKVSKDEFEVLEQAAAVAIAGQER
jgi:hypothetical protein